MIESIFSGISKKNDQQNSIAAVSIEILPEFGWRIGNRNTFGPGTLFQGYVVVKCNQYSARATRLRLHFTGTESMLTCDVGPGVIRTKTNVLFGVGSTLWQKGDEDDSLCSDIKYKFLFTLQMPMVQYPPSINHNLYRCCYKLSAYLDPSLGYGEIPVMAQTNINYIPLIETRLLKAPLSLERKGVSVKLYSTEYISGDTLRFAICSSSTSSTDAKVLSTYVAVHTSLYRILNFSDPEVPTVTEVINTQTIHLHATQLEKELWLSFKLGEDLTPTVTYSSILSLTYKLKIKITGMMQQQNKLKRIWPLNNTYSFEVPITIGTMGIGVRVVDDELRLYGGMLEQMPSPKFVKNLEHEDVLPKYEPARLPCYTDNNPCENVSVGRITPASSVTIIRSSL